MVSLVVIDDVLPDTIFVAAQQYQHCLQWGRSSTWSCRTVVVHNGYGGVPFHVLFLATDYVVSTQTAGRRWGRDNIYRTFIGIDEWVGEEYICEEWPPNCENCRL
jgi:hypothetical protein